MTTPYSPATATALAGGCTDQGWVENTAPAWAGGWIARNTLSTVIQQAGALAVAQRDRDAALRRRITPAPTAAIRILTVGDSITVGYGSADNCGWRAWLADLIDQQGTRAAISMHAHGGWSLADAAPGLAAALAAATPDIVTLMLGTNDWLYDTASQTAWQNAYGAAIDQILASSPTARVVCALIPISQRGKGIQDQETRANAAAQAAAAARASTGRVVVADCRPATSPPWARYATDDSAPPTGGWTIDGVHPGDAGYAQMADLLYATIQPWLPTP